MTNPSEQRAQSGKFLRALRGETMASPPVWLMRQAGRYLPEYRAVRGEAGSFLAMCMNPTYAAEVTLQPIRRFGFDASIIFADILLIPMALGLDLTFAEGEGPRLTPVSDGAAVAKLRAQDCVQRLSPVFESLERVRGGLPEDTALIGFAGAPWTVATYMVAGQGSDDQRAARLMAYRAPDDFQRLIDLLVAVTADYLIAQARAGANAVQIFDSWAAMLPEDQFTRWVIAPTVEIMRRVKAAVPGLPIIGFPRGARDLTRYVRETGVDALGMDTAVPAAFARAHLQPMCPVQGNLDPLALIAGGAALEGQVRHLRENLGGGPWVFNLGHGILPETPVAHVEALMRLVRAA